MIQRVTVKSEGSGKIQLLLILAVIVVPMVIAFFWRPTGAGNYGELVQPVRPIQDVVLQTLAGESRAFSELKGKWTLIYFAAASCPPACEQDLDKLRRIRLSLSENARRVQYAFVITRMDDDDRLRVLTERHPAMLALTGTADNIAALERQFTSAPERIFLVDPLGNLMMSYPPNAEPRGIRSDLVRLLKVSRIG